MSLKNNYINYIELKAKDLKEIKYFYTNSFNWSFTDYGPNYTAFSNSGLEGGFEKAKDNLPFSDNVLIVLYHDNIDYIKNRIIEFGGTVTKEIFSFPGGRRFHFTDPSGNELAVWTDK